MSRINGCDCKNGNTCLVWENENKNSLFSQCRCNPVINNVIWSEHFKFHTWYILGSHSQNDLPLLITFSFEIITLVLVFKPSLGQGKGKDFHLKLNHTISWELITHHIDHFTFEQYSLLTRKLRCCKKADNQAENRNHYDYEQFNGSNITDHTIHIKQLCAASYLLITQRIAHNYPH